MPIETTRARPSANALVLGAVLAVASSWLMLSPAAHAADPTIAAAGNIACDTSSPYFNGGAGTATRCHQGATARLLSSGLTAVLALGDNQYCCGSLASFLASYDHTWGAVKPITRPVPGNREYSTPAAAGYFDYFNGPGLGSGPAGLRGQGYYSFDLGSWHLVALNTNCAQVPCSVGSAQERWLRGDLAAHPAACTLAFTHVPRFSSGIPGGAISVKPLWQALYEGGTEVVLSAHARDYERFLPQAPSGRFDAAFGARQFVVGTGGYLLGQAGKRRSHSELFQNTAFGTLELTLHPTTYHWRFIAEGGAVMDSGTSGCHGPPPVARPAPQPTSGKTRTRCTISGGSITMTPRGLVGVRVRCPFKASGIFKLKTARAVRSAAGPKRRRLRLGRKRFTISRAGRTATVRVRLSSKGRRLLKRKKRLRAKATAVVSQVGVAGKAGRTKSTRTITIKAPHKRGARAVTVSGASSGTCSCRTRHVVPPRRQMNSATTLLAWQRKQTPAQGRSHHRSP